MTIMGINPCVARTVHSCGHSRWSSERCAKKAMRSAMQARFGLPSRLWRPPNSSASAPACSWVSPVAHR